MSNFQIKPAIKEGVFLFISLAGASGSGKTFTALELAMGITGGDVSKIGFIDTEGRRGLHYADIFGKFRHLDFEQPFSSMRYVEAIEDIEKDGCSVCIIDSASHGHAGTGGMLEFQEEELQRMAGNDWKKRESCKMAAWIKPKTHHKKFVEKFLQSRMHIIFCFRAEDKVEMRVETDSKGKRKTSVVSIGWQPICEKNLPYEMTCSFTLDPAKPGVLTPIKPLQEQHKPFFPLDKPISRKSGELIAKWASGGEPPQEGQEEIELNDNIVGWIQQINRCTKEEEIREVYKRFTGEKDMYTKDADLRLIKACKDSITDLKSITR